MYLEGELTGLAAGSMAGLGGCYRKGSNQVGFGSVGERCCLFLDGEDLRREADQESCWAVLTGKCPRDIRTEM